MQPKRVYSCDETYRQIKKTKLEVNYFQVFPRELMEEILKNLPFERLETLLQVSKIFKDIIIHCALPVKSKPDLYDLINSHPSSSKAKFWGQFQKILYISPENINKTDEILSQFNKKESRLLFPNINRLYVDFEDADFLSKLKMLNISSGNSSFVSKLELEFFIPDKFRYRKLLSEIKRIVRGMENLKTINLLHIINMDKDAKLSTIASSVVKHARYISPLLLDLGEKSASDLMFYYDKDFVHNKRLRLVWNIFSRSLSQDIGLPVFNKLQGSLKATIGLSYANNKFTIVSDYTACSSLVIDYEVSSKFDFVQFQEKLHPLWLSCKNLEEVILKPVISISDNLLANVDSQIDHENFVRKVKDHLESKTIRFKMDFSNTQINIDGDGILNEANNFLKGIKEKILNANMCSALLHLQEIIQEKVHLAN